MRKKYILAVILITAAILRFWNLGYGDVTGSDEVLYAFRAVRMLDFDNAEHQTTPLEWFDARINADSNADLRERAIPGWTKLSFHDHPPLVFLIQHVFIRIFGENNFAFRLSSALLGIASVYLIYLIGSVLFSRNAGLFSAALLGVTVNHVFISRIGIQEPYVIFFILLAIYFFLRAFQKDTYFLWMGAAVGLGLLTKYTVFIVVPIFFAYLLFFKRQYLGNKKLWLGVLLAVILFSPVLAYNFKLYQAVGHFDFQISYILGQKPEVWKDAPGKEEIGALADRLRDFIPNLLATNSWLFLGFFGFAAAVFLVSLKPGSRNSIISGSRSSARDNRPAAVEFSPPGIFSSDGSRNNRVFTTWIKNSLKILKNHAFLLLIFSFLILLLFLIGPTFRFLTMLTPFLALGIAAVFSNIRWRPFYVALTAVLIFEIGYSVNSQILSYPKGPEFWSFSKVRFENYNWGYNELDRFLQKELAGKYPALNFRLQYQFLEDIKNESIKKDQARGDQPYPALIVYDSNIQQAAQLWLLDRLQIYHGWPIIKAQDYFSLPQKQDLNYYFIFPTDKIPLKKPERLTAFGANLETELLYRGLVPEVIFNKRGDQVFRIYRPLAQ